jgi:GNAT superfamily N-acetyltransferase
MSEILVVTYEKNDDSINLFRVDEAKDVSEELAAQNMRLLAAAYAHQFEEPTGILPRDTFARRHDPEDPHLLERHLDRMVSSLESESQYWFSYVDEGLVMINGLSKVSPSRSNQVQKARLSSPNAYLNDLLVDPSSQRKGLGSGLLHAPLKFGGFGYDKALALDAFKGNPQVNSWFERLGMLPVEAEVGPFDIDGIHSLEQIRYSTPESVNVGQVRIRLERAHPILKEFELIET